MRKYDNLILKSMGILKNENVTIIGQTNDRIFAFNDPNELIIKIAKYLNGKNTLNTIYKNLLKEHIYVSKGEICNIIDEIFYKNNLILKKHDIILLDKKSMSKYDRILNFYSSYPNIDFEIAQQLHNKLANSHIILLGIGGIGSHIAHTLVASGIKKLTIVDFDKIELSNITRQMLYTEIDVGKFKIDVAEKKLKQINPEVEIDKYNICFKSLKDIEDFVHKVGNFDFLITTLDNPRGEIRMMLDKVLYNTNRPYIYNGSVGATISVGPIIKKGITKSLNDMGGNRNLLNDELKELNNTLYKGALLESFNGVAGQICAYEVIKYLINNAEPQTIGKELLFNLDNFELVLHEYGQ